MWEKIENIQPKNENIHDKHRKIVTKLLTKKNKEANKLQIRKKLWQKKEKKITSK
jgi:hypothetical protein